MTLSRHEMVFPGLDPCSGVTAVSTINAVGRSLYMNSAAEQGLDHANVCAFMCANLFACVLHVANVCDCVCVRVCVRVCVFVCACACVRTCV